MNKLVKNIIREGIEKLQPYNSARNEDNYGTEIWLDLNEAGYAPFGYELNQKYNRYAEPQPKPLLNIFSNLYGVKKEEILMTRGGDEVIETLIKAFTTPYKSKIAITNPTFSCYKLFGEINGIEAIDIPLNKTTYLPV
ncbi:hypothetical protein FACS189459_3440 [Bacilli bacterium]|nr:hypothetical protein FACS189459_3440 [Bacilli bacterium]